MRLILIGVALVILMLAGGVPARADGLPATVPAALVKRLVNSPARVAEQAGDLIHGHGSGGAIDAAGLARSVAMDRAALRARALVPLMSADLDADGTVAAAEMAAVVAASGARARGGLMRAQTAADTDGDGAVSQAEMFVHAGAQAMARIDAVDEARIMALMTLDLNGDGRLTLPEVDQAAARARVTAAQARLAAQDT